MTAKRSFNVCLNCGAWKEVTQPLEGPALFAMFADYDLRFFVEDHLNCAYPSRGTDAQAGIACVYEDDPGFEPLPPERQWLPEHCPRYRPPQSPTEVPYKGDTQAVLVGIWSNTSFGSHSNEDLVFLPRGEGVLEYWNVVFAGYERFRWCADAAGYLLFGDGTGSDGAARYFGSPRVRFEVLAVTNRYGETRDTLRVYSARHRQQPEEFRRTLRTVEGYHIPEPEEPNESLNLTGEVLWRFARLLTVPWVPARFTPGKLTFALGEGGVHVSTARDHN